MNFAVRVSAFFGSGPARAFPFLLMLSAALLSTSCGGNSKSNSSALPAATYSIGGTVSGVAGAGLVLQDNGGNNLTVSAIGSFTFSAQLAGGTAYAVTVLTQPSNPGQTCAVANGSGTASANVTSVQVSCTTIPTFTIGGTVAGLAGSGLVLQDNGANNLSILASGSFTFTTPVVGGAAYSVTVLTQPSSPIQVCAVAAGSGTASANVTSVQVACTTPIINQWSWVSGSNLANQPGTYGTLGAPAPSNVPGARQNSFTWIDASGNLWLFGGYGLDSTGQLGELNDLWKYTAGEWIWMGGSNVYGQAGNYGVQGTADPSNIPPARDSGVSWTDAAGNFWLFGGTDYNLHTNTGGFLNDLWKYSGGEWTWVSGSSLVNQTGTYGTQGTAAPGNVPGSRVESVGWIDAAGNLWLFGGYGTAPFATRGNFSDLWEYSAGEWTWVDGPNTDSQSGVYGTLGTAGSANVPGARNSAVGWTDASGIFWLFGGNGLDSTGNNGFLNDLWKYGSGEWTWMSGSNLVNQPGIYGAQGTAAPGNVPPGRQNSFGWSDDSGNIWLFGGNGQANGDFNDLWKYNTGEWTWMAGAATVNQPGVYGTLGVAASSNLPGARYSTVGWTGASGDLWLFGGIGYDSTGLSAFLNDLWKYQP